MDTPRVVLHPRTRAKPRRNARRCRDADTRARYLIVSRADQGHSGKRIARELGCCCATVSRTTRRYETVGEAGLIDRREDNGQAKADDLYARTAAWILDGSPQDVFHRRPTWTRRLLIETARRYTGVTVSPTTMGRLPKRVRVRRGRPKPLAPCPWGKAARKRRMAMIHALVDTRPAGQACVWEDEADIDLRPRIGLDWMLPGTQRAVMTPGKNVKRYLAGAMGATTDRAIRVRGARARPAGCSSTC